MRQSEIDKLAAFQDELDYPYFLKTTREPLPNREERMRWAGERLGKAALRFRGLQHASRFAIAGTLERQLVPEITIAMVRFAHIADVNSVSRTVAHIKPGKYDLEEARNEVRDVRDYIDDWIVDAQNNDPRSGSWRDFLKAEAVVPLYRAAAGLCLQWELGDMWKLYGTRYKKIVDNDIASK